MSEILRIYTEEGNRPKATNEIKLMVGDKELGGVTDIKINDMRYDSVVTATITLAVRLGDEPQKN